MPLPPSIQTVTVSGQYTHPDGSGMRGSVKLKPRPNKVVAAATGVTVQGEVREDFDADGAFTLPPVVATDADGINPNGFTYDVFLTFYDAPNDSFAISLPKAAPTVVLNAITPAAPAEGEYVVVTGPQGPQGPAGPAGATGATGAAGPAGPTQAVVTADQLTASSPWYVAHRGSGGEFPEHTLRAFDSAVASGVSAIEVSAHTTADGVPVVFHDTTLDRVTDWTGPIADWTYAALRERVKIKAWELLGPGWADQEIPTLREILDRFLGRVVIFLEAKSNPAIPIVQQMLLASYPGAQQSVVWKNYYQSTSFPWAKANGFKTWAYIDSGTTSTQMDAVAANVDMWGVPIEATDAKFAEVVARGKPVMSWEIHRRYERDRLTSLGVQGVMCSQLLYVRRTTPVHTRDDFAAQIKAPGDIGVGKYDPVFALKYDTDPGGDAFINSVPNQAVLLGSLCPTPASDYTIRFDMQFENVPPSTQHSGIAFAKPDDSKYQFNSANASGGYHVVLRGNGDLQLYRHDPGVTSGTKIGEVLIGAQPPGSAPVAGTWMTFEAQVTPTQVILRRTDVEPDVVITANDTTYRGGYLHLSTGSVDSTANKPHWRNVQII